MQNNQDIIKILRLMQAVNKMNEKPSSPLNDTTTPIIRSLRAASPYFPLEQQKNISIIVKMMEIMEMMNKYRKIAEDYQESNTDYKQAFLMAFREQANENQKKMIDAFIKLSQINILIEKND